MVELSSDHSQWLTTALIIVALVAALTIYGFWRKRYADRGPKKGEAKHPEQVRRQNPPDRDRA